MPELLFPEIPEDLKALTADERQKLEDDFVSAAALIDADDEEFLAGLTGDEIIAQYETGVENLKKIRAVKKELAAEHEAFLAKKAELKAEIDETPEEEEPEATEEETVEVVAQNDPGDETDEPTEVEETVEEQVPVTASAPAPRFARTPPAPAPARIVVEDPKPTGVALVASGGYGEQFRGPLAPDSLAALGRAVATDLGPLAKTDRPGKYVTKVQTGDRQHFDDGRIEWTGPEVEIVWDGPKTKMASATFEFPGDRVLNGGDDDIAKIREVMPSTVEVFGQRGGLGGEALVASGGICAPSTPFYGMVNFGTEAEPVWDALPVFQAARGGVNVPESTYIADITSAISSISEANDAAGGTFATKSCQDLTCPSYTETFVNIFAHCREYGNLNARTWPEKIAHENALTMQALARTSEDFMLERIKALSINVTNGVETLGALIYLVDAIVKAKFGIAGRLRMPANARFRALLPSYALDLLLLDTIQTQFDRFKSKAEINAYLREAGIDPVYYLDGNFAAGDDQLPDAAQAAGALEGFPNTVQWALYPDGAFLGIDSGSLELGIVRDSTLNSTNDFQVFGERFRNLVRIAPAQAAYWVTTDWCPSGQFPPAGTARTCE